MRCRNELMWRFAIKLKDRQIICAPIEINFHSFKWITLRREIYKRISFVECKQPIVNAAPDAFRAKKQDSGWKKIKIGDWYAAGERASCARQRYISFRDQHCIVETRCLFHIILVFSLYFILTDETPQAATARLIRYNHRVQLVISLLDFCCRIHAHEREHNNKDFIGERQRKSGAKILRNENESTNYLLFRVCCNARVTSIDRPPDGSVRCRQNVWVL